MTRRAGRHGHWERLLQRQPGALLRYGVAVALALGSLGLVQVLHLLDAPGAASLALATVVVSGIYGGFGPALLDAAITSVGIEYLSAPAFRLLDSWADVFSFGLHVAVGWVIADITASLRVAYRRLSEEHAAAELARRARENVLAIVSHDLRSPLSVIKLAIETLLRAGRSGRRAADDPLLLQSMSHSAGRMNRIIEDLLDAVRIEKGQFRVQFSEHALSPILEEALQSVRAFAEGRGIRLHARLPAGDSRLRCDAARLLQVFSNLLHNAVKFSPEGGVVELSAHLEAGEARVSVRDYGPGIDPQVSARLFQRYWQAPGTAHQGTGLGLFIARSIVEAHGGRIEAASSPGQGACFTVTLAIGLSSRASE